MDSVTNKYIQAYFEVPKVKADLIAPLFKAADYKKGDFLVREGQQCLHLGFIVSGFMRVYNYKDGRDITQWISCQDDLITDLSSFTFHTPSRWNIQAMSDVQLQVIHRNDFENITSSIPDWDKIIRVFLSKCFLNLEDRVFSFLALSAQERYDQLFASKPDLFNQVPLHNIASMLGMSPETLSRIRSKQIS